MCCCEAITDFNSLNSTDRDKRFRKISIKLFKYRIAKASRNTHDANLSKALVSIGAVKGIEIGDGFAAAHAVGSENNDSFYINEDGNTAKKTNHAGGILGGISDGDTIIVRAAVKPTPSIFRPQQTISRNKEPMELTIKGRHDPLIVPRAVVVVEAMCALTIADSLLLNMTAQMDGVLRFYNNK